MAEDCQNCKDNESKLEEIKSILDDLVLKFETHLTLEQEYKPKIMEVITLLEQSKGVIIFLKAVLYISAPVAGLIYWLKEHVKL
jgi:hypothetical protein